MSIRFVHISMSDLQHSCDLIFKTRKLNLCNQSRLSAEIMIEFFHRFSYSGMLISFQMISHDVTCRDVDLFENLGIHFPSSEGFDR